MENKIFKDITFVTVDNTYLTPYTSLDSIFLAHIDECEEGKVIIGNQSFLISENIDCFSIVKGKLFVNLSLLLGFKTQLNNSQVLNILTIIKGKEYKTDIIYLNNFSFQRELNFQKMYDCHLTLSSMCIKFSYSQSDSPYVFKLNLCNTEINLLISWFSIQRVSGDKLVSMISLMKFFKIVRSNLWKIYSKSASGLC